MIPIFKAGDPLSAGKFNALGDSIRHLSENVSTAGEMMVPQHFDALPLPEMETGPAPTSLTFDGKPGSAVPDSELLNLKERPKSCKGLILNIIFAIRGA